MFCLCRETLEIADLINHLFEEQFHIVIVVIDLIFELLSDLWIFAYYFLERRFGNFSKRAIIIGNNSSSTVTMINQRDFLKENYK